MTFITYTVGIIIMILVSCATAHILYIIYKDILKHDFLNEKYKVSFKKHFKKAQVPLIKMNLGGKLYYFLVDSGADSNLIDTKFLDTLSKVLYTTVEETSDIIGVGGTCNTKLINTTLSFRDSVYVNTEFKTLDMSFIIEFIQHKTKIPIIGVLGAVFFAENKWMLDFDSRCIWVNTINKDAKV